MSYLCAGVFAEGSTDYSFLLPLLDRLLPELVHTLPADHDLGVSVQIGPPRVPTKRAHEIASAIEKHWGQCTLFVIHADGAGDPDRARREQVEPGLRLVRSHRPDLAAVACIPVREIEAWLLADTAPFSALYRGASPTLPEDPERILDPKRALLDALARSRGSRRRGPDPYEFFGANVSLDRLRQLPAFQRFEADLIEAIARATRA
jgi:hypothetical protein